MKGITARQRQAIEALMSTPTLDQAAARVGIHRATLWRWLHEDATFCAEVQRAQADALAGAVRGLTRLSDQAVGVLGDAMRGGETTAVRIRAADAVLGRLMQLRELIDLEERIAAVERRLLDQEGAE